VKVCKAIVIFFSVLHHLKIEKPTSQGEKQTKDDNNIYADILELCSIIKMSHINGKGIESTNQFRISY
jgi:hypothetical protein